MSRNKQGGGDHSRGHRKPIVHKPQPGQGTFRTNPQGFFSKKAAEQAIKIQADAENNVTVVCLLPMVLGSMRGLAHQ